MRGFISLFFLGFLSFVSSCIVEGGDPEVIEVCKHLYTSKVEVVNIPEDNYDFLNGPDLRVELKRSAAKDWEFSTNTEDNWDEKGSVMLYFASEIYLTDEAWEIHLLDDDSPDADDEICWDIFDPVGAGEDGVIEFGKNGVVALRLYYVEREK